MGVPKGSTKSILLGERHQPPDRTSSNRTPPRSPTKATSSDYTGQIEKGGPVDTMHSLLKSYPAKVNGDTDLGRVTVIVLRTSGTELDEPNSQVWTTAVRDRVREKINARRRVTGSVVKYIGFAYIDGTLAVLKEFIESTSAKEHLARKSMREKEKRQLIFGFAQALEALHFQGLAHGSIEPHHFIVDRKGRPMIDGWWFNRMVEEEFEKVSPSEDYCGSARYTAPEVLESKKTDLKSDVYSFALVAIELMTGKQPFDLIRQNATVMKLITQGAAPFGKDDAELRKDPWWPTLEKCLSKDPADRPLMSRVSIDLSATLP
ncbi:hypothetical protein FRC04_007156 [Tulasnella sp. 424]|nr:hypothetical protein FRC04_007156 [Tulasnella sp. 424]KAG8974594.1 hypothetical protein FRC05_007070 [Tulasnella sp. 425]